MDVGVGKVGLGELRQIINDTDPRKAVGKVIQELHKDLAKIQKQIEKAKQEERVKLRKIENKIREAVQVLKMGGDIDQAADLLNEIKVQDPLIYGEIKSKVDKLKNVAEELRRNRMQTLDNSLAKGVLA